MATTKINVSVDEETKQAVEVLLDEMGLNMTSAINIYLKRIILERGIPFEINLKTPNPETIAAMNEYDEMKKNPQAYKRYSSFKEALNEVL